MSDVIKMAKRIEQLQAQVESAKKTDFYQAFVANLMDGAAEGRITITMDGHDLANELADIAQGAVTDAIVAAALTPDPAPPADNQEEAR